MEINSIFQGKYKIIKSLGKGGMGAVYLGKNINLGNYLAIKQIKKNNSGIDIKAEQKILTELNHPSIVKIFDVAEDNRNIYLIEEYIDGCTLTDTLYKKNTVGKKIGLSPIEEDVIVEWAKQIVEALDYLHNRKPYPIIYRDLKLGNIMLDSNGRIKIIDFGIAKPEIEGNEDNNSGLTYLFAAPEQIENGTANVKTDIYALGIVLYILALGNKAKIVKEYNERKRKDVSKLIIHPMRELNPNLSIGLTTIIEKCIEQDPKNRYESAKQILNDLKNIYKYNSEYKSLVRKKYVTIATTIILLGAFTGLTKAGVTQLGVEKVEKYNGKIEVGQGFVSSGSYDMALATFKEAIKIIPDNTEGYKNIGKMYYEIGEYEKCINYFESDAFIQESSLFQDADCMYILGSAYYKQGEYLSAIDRFNKAVMINNKAVNYLRDLAVSYAKNNQIDKAKETLDKLTNEKAEEDVTSYVRGEILLKEGNVQDAINSFEISLNVASNDNIKSKAIISLAETYRDYKEELGYGAIDREIEILEKAKVLMEEKNNLVITEMIAKAYYDKAIESDSFEYYEKSINSFKELLSLGYRRPYIYRNIAIIYQQQLNDYYAAEEILLKMKEAFPQDVGCYTQLSLLSIESENNKTESERNYEKANEYYEQALKLNNGESNQSIQQLMGLIEELKSKGWIN